MSATPIQTQVHKPVRYGILGFGHHAVKRLMPAFAGAQYARAEGLWRRDPGKAREHGQRFGIPRVFSSAEELCASPEIDAVFVVSPDAFHLEHVLLALAHRKPVLCEKPLAMNVGQAEQMLAAARSGNLAPIGDVGIHCIDALGYVLDTQVTAVNTLAHKDGRSGEVESHGVVALDFTSGAMGVVTVSTRAAYRSLVEVTGERGLLSCEAALTVDHAVTVLLRRGAEIVAEEHLSNADAFSRMLDSFALSLSGQAEYLATGEQGVQHQRVLDAAYASWHTGQRVLL